MRKLRPLISRVARTGVLKPQAKARDPLYVSSEYKTWREIVVARAGRRCEWVNIDGSRCSKAEPDHRMFADHQIEVKDEGAKFDPANGWCLCGAHHTAKTLAARQKRAGG